MFNRQHVEVTTEYRILSTQKGNGKRDLDRGTHKERKILKYVSPSFSQNKA